MAVSVSSPVISVIVPICNVGHYLDQCLCSIENQVLSDIEIICINDGSTDDSLSIIKRHAKTDKRYVVVDKENEGYGASCNRGIDLARGTWVAIIEPDDWIEPTMFSEMIGFARHLNKNVDVVKTPWYEVEKWDDPAQRTEHPSRLYHRLSTSGKLYSLGDAPILIEIHPAVWSALYKRRYVLEKHIRFIPYPGAGWADNPFLIDSLAQTNRIAYLDIPFYHYRVELPRKPGFRPTIAHIEMPFDRWVTMLEHLKRFGMDSPDLLASHYLRGFNYATQMFSEVGEHNPVLQAKVEQVFALMDSSIVLNCPKLSRKRKRWYFNVRGESCPHIPVMSRLRYLVSEALFRAGVRAL